MRILTVRQPWASAVIHASTDPRDGTVRVKTVENRTRNVAGIYRGAVAIHAARSYDEGAFSVTEPHPLEQWWNWYDGPQLESTLGHILGVVDLVDVHVGPEFGGGCHQLNSPLPVTPTYELCSPWGEAGAYHLVFANPRPLSEPIPYKGALSLRRFNETVDAEILRKLAEVA